MKVNAVRLYGVSDLRLDTFDLPEIKDDEILVKIITDSVCMSTYKLTRQGGAHKRAPKNLDVNPVITGHEMCGVIIKVGEKWKGKYNPGDKFTMLPSVMKNGILETVGYYFGNCGGDSTYSIIPKEYMENDCILVYRGNAFFQASLAEPVSCIIAGYKRMYHTSDQNHVHIMGVRKGGSLIIFGACGPMGLEAIDYALQLDDGPSMVVATDISADRLARAEKIMSTRNRHNRKLVFFNSAESKDVVADLMALTDGRGYDDVLIYAPVRTMIEQADKVLGKDGCFLFFSGPVDKTLSAEINMYNIHYLYTHFVGFSGSTNEDMADAVKLTEQGRLCPSVMITHVGGLKSAIDATLNLPKIPGGKKLIYTQIDMPLTAISDFPELGKTNPLFRKLADSCSQNNGCWNDDAEKILMDYYNVDLTK